MNKITCLSLVLLCSAYFFDTKTADDYASIDLKKVVNKGWEWHRHLVTQNPNDPWYTNKKNTDYGFDLYFADKSKYLGEEKENPDTTSACVKLSMHPYSRLVYMHVLRNTSFGSLHENLDVKGLTINVEKDQQCSVQDIKNIKIDFYVKKRAQLQLKDIFSEKLSVEFDKTTQIDMSNISADKLSIMGGGLAPWICVSTTHVANQVMGTGPKINITDTMEEYYDSWKKKTSKLNDPDKMCVLKLDNVKAQKFQFSVCRSGARYSCNNVKAIEYTDNPIDAYVQREGACEVKDAL